MATLPSIFSISSSSLPLHRFRPSISLSFSPLTLRSNPTKSQSRSPFLVLASSTHHSFDDFTSKKSALSELIQEIEPLDVSYIQKDVPPTTVDAMKRTISGMLGLLPSDQFTVIVEALWEPLSKLLISSIMTGYTLRNAEYRLCLEKTLDICERDLEKPKAETAKFDLQDFLRDSVNVIDFGRKNNLSPKVEKSHDHIDIEDLGQISAEAQEYISNLQSRLSSMKKELREVKRKSAALQMQQFVGEEKNDLLDYLRSLQPEQLSYQNLHPPSLRTSSYLSSTVSLLPFLLRCILNPQLHQRMQQLEQQMLVMRTVLRLLRILHFNFSLLFH
ncbi:unnamed protein product [Trifolium pratense]|uniref:Uncharacterized protein n=1 Tax=Trifolium pratense TaxID=57577 RepID=A0ACB0IES7_TRIPR|nr:unnamed protein product [Trifolium pratense]